MRASSRHLRPGAAALALATFIPGAARAADGSACVPPAQPVFSCGTGAKSIAVCASPALGATGGTLQYRFGPLPPAPAELLYPPAGVDWRPRVEGGTLAFSGGGGAFLAFTNAPYRYVVYTAVGQGWGRKAGVAVEKDGRRVANIACQGAVVSELGPDLFTRAGIRETDRFGLP